MSHRTIAANNLQVIKLMKNLVANRKLSEIEKDLLKSFKGWGSCSDLFSKSSSWTVKAYEELQKLCTKEEIAFAQESILNSFYTSPEVIKAIWDGVMAMGFTGGKVLEPSCGNGLFLQHQPQHINCDWTCIELDPISARICSLLNEGAKVYNVGFENFQSPPDQYDLVIGNVPFGTTKLVDPYVSDSANLLIHNFFIVKSLQLVREGGLLVLITSTGTMDTISNELVRNRIYKEAELITAIRLPNTAFRTFSGTEVTSDILVLRKNKEPVNTVNWRRSDKFDGWTFDDLKSSLPPIETTVIDYDNVEFPLSERSIIRNKKIALKQFQILLLEKGVTKESWHCAINLYYLLNLENLLGSFAVDTLYGGDRMALQGDDRDLGQAIRKILYDHPDQYIPAKPDSTPPLTRLLPPSLMGIVNDGEFIEFEGRICVYRNFSLNLVSDILSTKVRDFIYLYGNVKEIFEAQKKESDEYLISLRHNLNQTYEKFIAKYGYINSKINVDLFGQDPKFYTILALEIECQNNQYPGMENLVKHKKHYRKADIFFKRTGKRIAEPQSCERPEDALLQSLNHKGRIDIKFIASLMDKSIEDTVLELQSNPEPLIFFDPDKHDWVTKEEYLAGKVVEKLEQALLQSNLEINVKALESVQPLWLTPPKDSAFRNDVISQIGEEKCILDIYASIDVNLGASWIPVCYYEAFAKELFADESLQIQFEPISVTYFVIGSIRASNHLATVQYGISQMSGMEILEHGLNLKPILIKEWNATLKASYVNYEATEGAKQKLQEIKDKFSSWLWNDIDRALKLTILYNTKFNKIVDRKYRGSHLTLPGSNPDVELRPHQKDGIWRITQNKATMLAWVVGAGKTFAMIGAAMELRRLGLSYKPMFVALNSTVTDIANAFKWLYPNAQILVGQEKSFSPDQRKRFVTSIATGDWDCIIISHSQWKIGITISPSTRLKYIDEEMEEIKKCISELKGDSPDNSQRQALSQVMKLKEKREDERTLLNAGFHSTKKISKTKKKEIKDAIKAAHTLKERVETVENSQDQVIFFEDLGVDVVLFDESQVLKNLGYMTKITDIAGLPNTDSQRALDSFIKFRWLLDQGGRVIFATGTPVSNTLAESWTIMRYLMLDQLKQMGMANFDACLSTFFSVYSESELSPTGYKVKTRCRNLIMAPEFISMLRTVMDVCSQDKLKLPVPKFREIDVAVPPNEQQIKYLHKLVRRYELVEAHLVDKKDDNRLSITTDGRAAALDIRLRNREGKNYPTSKLNQCATNVYLIWKATEKIKGTQAVFCDFSAPRQDGRLDMYNALKDTLVALGIPSEQIAFIHDCDRNSGTKNKKRAELYKKVNSGEVRIFMASTEKGGTGVNVQERMIALHHLDINWRPSDKAQREGRIIRQGNKLPEIFIFRYATQGAKGVPGADAVMWQIIMQKLISFEIFMSDEIAIPRDLGEVSSSNVLSIASIRSQASGNPLEEKLFDITNRLNRMSLRRNSHLTQAASIKRKVQKLKAEIQEYALLIETVKADKALAENIPKSTKLAIEGEEVEPKKISEVLSLLSAKFKGVNQQIKIGRFGVAHVFVNEGEFFVVFPKEDGEKRLNYWITPSHNFKQDILKSIDEKLEQYIKGKVKPERLLADSDKYSATFSEAFPEEEYNNLVLEKAMLQKELHEASTVKASDLDIPEDKNGDVIDVSTESKKILDDLESDDEVDLDLKDLDLKDLDEDDQQEKEVKKKQKVHKDISNYIPVTEEPEVIEWLLALIKSERPSWLKDIEEVIETFPTEEEPSQKSPEDLDQTNLFDLLDLWDYGFMNSSSEQKEEDSINLLELEDKLEEEDLTINMLDFE